MPGFLSKYEGTTRVEIDEDYWVEVKKTLTWAEADDAEKAGLNFSMQPNMDNPGKTRTDVVIDPDAKLFEQVFASLVAWNLDDENGKLWPLDYDRQLEQASRARSKGQGDGWKSPRRRSLECMPKPVFDILAAVVGKANQAPTREDQQSFRAGNGSSPPGGPDQPPDPGEVLHGAEVVAAAGDPGGPPPPV
jgi:hypothetical protein